MNQLYVDNYEKRCLSAESFPFREGRSNLLLRHAIRTMRLPRRPSIQSYHGRTPRNDIFKWGCPYLFMIYNRNGGVQRDRPLAEELGVSPRFY